MMRPASGIKCFLGLLAALLCSCRAAQGADQLIVGASTQRMPGADGGRLGLDWVHGLRVGSLSIGASRTQTGPSSWTLISVGGARAVAKRWTLAGGADLGPATIGADDVTFMKFRTEASVPIGARWTLSAQHNYIDVDPVYGHLVGVGGRIVRESGLSFGVLAFRSVGGNLDEGSLSLRIDYRGRAPYPMAGLVVGKSNNGLRLNLPSAQAATTRLRQGFVGLTFVLDAVETTVVLEAADVGGVRRFGLGVSLRLPVGRSR